MSRGGGDGDGAHAHRILIDGGTTTTRAWAVDGDTILAQARATVGARDTARDGSHATLEAGVRDLLASVSKDASSRMPHWQASCVVAAGMITSPLGLGEVPHVAAPAGIEELAAAVREISSPDVTSLPILLVPGVRCGIERPQPADIASVDVMRGEETVCLGLVRTGVLQAPADALSVGSHWKRVGIGADGCIDSCVTTLSGELLHVLRTQTVLAASVADELPARLDDDDLQALRAGVAECERSGLPRAAFCTRLLERVDRNTPRFRLAYLLGVVVADTLRHWGDLPANHTIALLGTPAICQAWQIALQDAGLRGLVVDEASTAQAFVAGLTAIADRHLADAGRSPAHA